MESDKKTIILHVGDHNSRNWKSIWDAMIQNTDLARKSDQGSKN